MGDENRIRKMESVFPNTTETGDPTNAEIQMIQNRKQTRISFHAIHMTVTSYL
jgi:hypothetical protein